MLRNDLVLRAARGERTPRTPVWLMRQAGRFDPQYRDLRQRADLPLELLFRHVDLSVEISLLPRRFGVDAIIFFQDILTPLAPMGADFVFRPGPVLESPIRDESGLARLRPYDPQQELPFIPATLQALKRELDGELPLLGFGGAPLTLAFFLLEGGSPHPDPQRTRSLMEQSPRVMHDLLDKLTAMTASYLASQIESGVDAVQLFESAADLVSLEAYEEFALPYQQRVFEAIGKRVPRILFAKDFADVELLTRAGADVISLSSAVDLAEARARIGPGVAVQGNVNNRLMVEGSPEAVEAAARRCIEAGNHSGHILNLGHGLLQDTPVENVQRLVNTAREMRLDDVAGATKPG